MAIKARVVTTSWEPRGALESMTGVLPLRPPAPPPARGPLLTPAQVAERIGDVSPAWVRRNVPHKVQIGHSTVRWFERDIMEWLETRREKAS